MVRDGAMKKIVTTYMMRKEVIELLNEAIKKTGRSKEDLIMCAMREMMAHHRRYQKEEGRIRYQERIDETTGLPIPKKRVKVRFWEREYKYFQDMRRVFLVSISHAIAIAIFEFISKIVEYLLNSKDEDVDNYPYCGYAIIEKCIENITTFHIWWGVPPNLEAMLK